MRGADSQHWFKRRRSMKRWDDHELRTLAVLAAAAREAEELLILGRDELTPGASDEAERRMLLFKDAWSKAER
jgi:hypothetical protein